MADNGRWVTSRIGATGFHTNIHAASHHLIADEPVTAGGTDRGPTPYEFLLAALGSCTVMTLRIYADRKGWPLEAAVVHLRSSRSHEKDCEDCATKKVDIGRIERRLEFEGPLTEEQRTRLTEIVDRCPVKQTFERGIVVEQADD
jgi:putative redox protein